MIPLWLSVFRSLWLPLVFVLSACGESYTVTDVTPHDPLAVSTSTATKYTSVCEAYCVQSCIIETKSGSMIARHVDEECAAACSTEHCS